MLKNILKAAATLLVLSGCYWGYVHAFDLVLRQFQTERFDGGTLRPLHSARSRQAAQELARLALGPDHWAVTSELPFAYYNSERGFWMYWKEYEEIKEENGVKYDGKRVRMHPFVMIGRSGKDIWTQTCDVATLDLNQPLGLGGKSQNSEGVKVVHALFEGDVRIRADRGTPGIKADDLSIGPMTYVDYDEGKRLITTESHVHIEDPDMNADGDGLEILLRKPDPNLAVAQKSSSSGFAGAEYAILFKNVRVVMRDAGNSGLISGGEASSRPARKPATASSSVDLTVKSTAKDGQPTKAPEAVPLFVQSDGLMHIGFPPDTIRAAVGPPAPPAPTLVRFERKVVALHGRLDDEPSQLDCDTLRLTLVPPSEESAPSNGKGSKKAGGDSPTSVTGAPPATAPAALVSADPGGSPKASPDDARSGRDAVGAGGSTAAAEAESSEKAGGLFGNLTLQKAHATGHVVWLQLRKQSARVRCTELIHERLLPYRPDSTFFRGDKTRRVWLEKIDYEPEEEGPTVADAGRPATDPKPKGPRKVKSVTHVETISAKLFDRGNGLDKVDIRAFGPGRLESRPDIGQPVERIADWQDELTVVNVLDPENKLLQKRVTLTGTRPFFVDLPKKTSLDAAQEIRVFLKPKSTEPGKPAPSTTAQAGAGRPSATIVAAGPAPPGSANSTGTGKADDAATTGLGGSMQIEHLLAYRDVHLKAPSRYLEAREYLDAPFIEVDPAPPAESSSPAEPRPEPIAAPPGEGEAIAQAEKPKAEEPKAEEARAEEPVEPLMTAVANRIWAKVAIPRGQSLDTGKTHRKKPKAAPAPPREVWAATDAPATGDAAATTEPEEKDAEAQIREAYLQGNVAVHQDKLPDPEKKDKARPKGDDIRGEAVYLDNRGPGKINAKVYHRDPKDPTFLPGPIQWAMVSTDDMVMYGQTLWVDQEHDKVYGYGPGILNQWTDRAMMTDKTPESQPAAGGTGEAAATMAARAPAPAPKAEAKPKPKTRAGVPVGDKDLITITWTKQMEFTGRTVAPTGHPAARVDFLGVVDANMTDASLHCEQKMIVYTDREVRLGELDAARGGRSAEREEPELPDGDPNAERQSPSRARVDIALLYCYGKPTAISRKVDPDLPTVIQQQRIDAWLEKARSQKERLAYNRRTGEFYVPCAGMVFLFDRPEQKDQKAGQDGGVGTGLEAGTRTRDGRTLLPSSGRTDNRGNTTATARTPATPPGSRKIPKLTLMQVKFTKGMIGRMGTGQAADKMDERWSEFYGNIEFVRSEVDDESIYVRDRSGRWKPQQILNPDHRLSEDGFYLTSQMLRIIQEPPPPGSPEKTPARSFAKAFDRVHVNKSESFSIQSDVATFDSQDDLIYAYGENGRGVSLSHQGAPGQPPSTSQAKAVQYNVKTKSWKEVEGSNLNWIDHRTGARPGPVAAPDPTKPKPPKVKNPYKVPNTNLERRGFTGF